MLDKMRSFQLMNFGGGSKKTPLTSLKNNHLKNKNIALKSASNNSFISNKVVFSSSPILNQEAYRSPKARKSRSESDFNLASSTDTNSLTDKKNDEKNSETQETQLTSTEILEFSIV
eukprot:Awhi_evm1s1248